MSETVQDVIAERASRYGEYKDQARLALKLQATLRDFKSRNHVQAWNYLPDYQQHALAMIMEKVARLMSGDPDYDDNWRDIAGYATLVLDRLPTQEEK